LDLKQENFIDWNTCFQIWKLNNFEGYLDIFTDGSKNEGMVGAAFGVPKMNVSKQFKLHSKASVFQAEAAASQNFIQIYFMKRGPGGV